MPNYRLTLTDKRYYENYPEQSVTVPADSEEEAREKVAAKYAEYDTVIRFKKNDITPLLSPWKSKEFSACKCINDQ